MSSDAQPKEVLVIGWSAQGTKATRRSDPWRDNQGPGKQRLVQGHRAGNSMFFPNQILLSLEKRMQLQWTGSVEECRLWGLMEVWLRVCVGAACRCLQVQLKVAEPRHMAFLAEESGFVSGVKAPLVPHWDDLQKAVCVWGGGSLLRCQL